jgi:hypothetical protein
MFNNCSETSIAYSCNIQLSSGIHNLIIFVGANTGYYNLSNGVISDSSFHLYNVSTSETFTFNVSEFSVPSPTPTPPLSLTETPSLSPSLTPQPSTSPLIPEFPIVALAITVFTATTLVGVLFARRKRMA